MGKAGHSPDARRKFELPYDQDVQAELNVEQWEQKGGSELYTFTHPQGSHDDRFWAVALAVYASHAGSGADKNAFIFV